MSSARAARSRTARLRHKEVVPEAESVVVEDTVRLADLVVNVGQHGDLHGLQAALLAVGVGPGVVAELRVRRGHNYLG